MAATHSFPAFLFVLPSQNHEFPPFSTCWQGGVGEVQTKRSFNLRQIPILCQNDLIIHLKVNVKDSFCSYLDRSRNCSETELFVEQIVWVALPLCWFYRCDFYGRNIWKWWKSQWENNFPCLRYPPTFRRWRSSALREHRAADTKSPWACLRRSSSIFFRKLRMVS